MKKGWKVFWIITGILGGIGLLLCGVALVMGITFQDIKTVYPNGIGIMNNVFSHRRIDKHNDYNDRNITDYDADEYEYSYEGITDFTLNVVGCDVIIGRSGDASINVDTDGLYYDEDGIDVSLHEADGKLTIETEKNGKVWTEYTGSDAYFGTLYIALPVGVKLDTADISHGCGELYLEEINAQMLNLNVGAGDFEVENFQAEVVTVNVGAGEIEMFGDFGKEFNLKCAAGDASIDLTGRKYDYNYILKSGLGDISIGDEEYGGLADARTIDNGAGKDMDIMCGAGEVSIDFNDYDD